MTYIGTGSLTLRADRIVYNPSDATHGYNTYVGVNAGYTNATGENNTFMGSHAGWKGALNGIIKNIDSSKLL